MLLFGMNFLQAQSLEDYIQMALKNSSIIKNKIADEKIAESKILEADAFPDTQINFGIYALQPETRVGNQVTKIGIGQQIPWFGTNKAKENWLSEAAGLKKYDTDLAKRNLTYQVKVLYYKMYEKQKLIEILKENKQILKTYEDMALGALSNNLTTMAEVLKIRARKNELHARIYEAIQDLEALKRQFNRLLERNLDEPVNLPARLDATDIFIRKKTLAQFPTLQKIKQSKEMYEAEKQWIKKQSKPKIRFGVDYISVQERTDMTVTNNGKDILMPSLGLSIPVFNRKYKSKITQTELKAKQTEWAYTEQKIQLENMLDDLETDFHNQLTNVLTADKNVKDTQLAIDVSLKAYETGMLDYDKILRLQLDKIQFQLKSLQATVRAFVIKARVEYLTKN